ncbi:ACT domain-containing protein [Nocardioides speluncae]|uniref:ACT domain-containing protein n=1 Tax=Nocardioides speluncae TaxID=2670337 RepID=UPI000D69F50F|nr:ACT domain-containing protein [Nocardioides speluncae]
MAYDVTLIFDDRPGELARLGEVAGAAGVNIDGFAAFTGEGKGVVHVLVADDRLDTLRDALTQAGMSIADEREVFVVTVADEPGALGEVTRRLADANVNIDLAYTTFGGVRMVFSTDDVRLAREALDG